jgi:hypothetical protein
MPGSANIPLIASGVVMLVPDMGQFDGARLTVVLEDISIADAPAQVVAGQRIEPLSYHGRDTVGISFELRSAMPTSVSALSVRAHLAFHPLADVECDDWVTVRTFPVRSPYPHLGIEVFLRKV